MSKDFLLLYDVDLQLLVNICNANLSQEKFLRVQFTAQHNYQHSVKYTGKYVIFSKRAKLEIFASEFSGNLSADGRLYLEDWL